MEKDGGDLETKVKGHNWIFLIFVFGSLFDNDNICVTLN